jgi:hypothetical protein
MRISGGVSSSAELAAIVLTSMVQEVSLEGVGAPRASSIEETEKSADSWLRAP